MTSAHGILSRAIHTVPLPYHISCYSVHMHASNRSTVRGDMVMVMVMVGTKCNSGVKPRLSTLTFVSMSRTIYNNNNTTKNRVDRFTGRMLFFNSTR